MNQSHAGGRKTQNSPVLNQPRYHAGLLERHVDDQLATMTAAMKHTFERLEAAPKEEFGTLRSIETNNAISLAKASAKLVLAVAKMRGEFHHNVNVRRGGFDGEAVFETEVSPADVYDSDRVPLFSHEELESISHEDLRIQLPIRKAQRAALRAAEAAAEAKALAEEVGKAVTEQSQQFA
ncbi:MAG: hypothetical protein KGI68_12625 [Alphaproteobacteria bacterium]|nr:hypothetical protein [Alphaproteobacteria bacterium]